MIVFICAASSLSATAQKKHEKQGDTVVGDTLKEVIVTAREVNGMTSSSRINRSAMEHLQPTSFTDLLELLPGNISHDPSMGTINSISLRETGTLGATGTKSTRTDYNISSLGTLFMIDGAPINGDANMQNIPNAESDVSSPEYARDMTNRGVDMRTIPTDNIESVEIVRGIPSVEYGNLTSGMVNIRRIRRETPLTVRFKADEYGKMFSIGKGVALSQTTILNLDMNYLDSKTDPRNRLENYKRLTASSRLNKRINLRNMLMTWNAGLDYTGSFDNSKTDPDLSYNKLNEYKSSYNRLALTNDIKLSMRNTEWLESISLNASASYQSDRLERRKQVAPQRASVAPTTMHEGVHDGQYLLGEYIADYLSDGKPMNLFLKLKANGTYYINKVKNSYKAGIEWTYSKNYGRGQVYDLTRPLSASWTTRPRAYRDIPGLQVLSAYAEENVAATLSGNRIELQAGVRAVTLPALDSRYDMSGRVFADPRINAVWHLPAVGGNNGLRLLVAGGYGMTTKMPTIDYLYPQCHYDDIIQLNYYDIKRPTELSRVNLRTYINDAANYGLRPARNHKWEIRLGAELAGNSLSVTYFCENLTDGFRYSSVYAPYEYNRYDASAIDAASLTAPPDIAVLPFTVERVLRGYSRVTNGSRLRKQGVELQLNTARWKSLRTALTVTGAWFRSTYSNSQMLYSTVSDVVDNIVINNKYIGLYDTNDGRVNEQLNTNFMFDTQVPRRGLIFTTTVQCMWFVKTTRLWQNGVPTRYMDAADGLTHDYNDEAVAGNYLLEYLVKTYNSEVYRPQRVPRAVYVNFKATKTIGRYMKLAVFVNRIIDHLPDYTSNGLTVRRSSSPYFGMEMNVKI